MERYQIIQPEMSETLRAIGKTNEEMAHEIALAWMRVGINDDISAADFYRYYDKGYQCFLKELEKRDAK